MKPVIAVVLACAVACGSAQAQLALPGAAPAVSTPEGSPKPKARHRPHRAAAPGGVVVDPASVVGRTLRLNGRHGELRLERSADGGLKIVKYALYGEVVSNPAQVCRIDIVADTPIAALSKGDPDGLSRFSAEIPACPLSFDIVADGVLVPPQTNACAFAAADCQASPSGLWGPEAAELEKDPKAISKARAAADRAIQDSLRELQTRDKDAAASLAREQSDFAAERDETCRDYAAEPRLGFCASRLAQSRAASLARRAAASPVAHAVAEPRRRKKNAP